MRIGNRVVLLKGPDDTALFSERNGFAARIPLGFGWRVTIRKITWPAPYRSQP